MLSSWSCLLLILLFRTGWIKSRLIVATTIKLHSIKSIKRIKRIKRINAFIQQTYNLIMPLSAVAFQLDFGTKRIPFRYLGTLSISLRYLYLLHLFRRVIRLHVIQEIEKRLSFLQYFSWKWLFMLNMHGTWWRF